MEGSIRLIWKCNHCNDVVISYSHLRHDMNVCECCKSGVDLEEHYQRGFGDIKDISRKVFKDGEWTKIIRDEN